MKTKIFFAVILLIFLTVKTYAQGYNINPNPNDSPFIAGDAIPLTAEQLSAIPVFELSPEAAALQVPSVVDNSQKIYMPPVFNQGGSSSCVQVAEVWYCFGYEMNRLRGVAAGDGVANKSNLFHPNFTYNFLNRGSETTGTGFTSGFNILKQLGCPSYDVYWDPALESYLTKYLYWMTGYDKYTNNNYILSHQNINWTSSYSSLNTIKNWLAYHGLNSDYDGGLAVIDVLVDTWVWENNRFPAGTPEQFKYFVSQWGTTGHHALTLVGYNDDVCCFDIDQNGVYENIDRNNNGILELSECEKGAFKAVNSWKPADFGDAGYIYLPYRLFSPGAGVPNHANICNVDEKLPDMSLKLEIEYPKRQKLCFKPAYGTTSCQTQSNGNTYYVSPYYNGGYNHMRGAYMGPIEMNFAYSSIYNLDNINKVFLKIHEVDTTTVHSTGTVNYFSLVDRRWNEVFELPMKIISPITLVDNDTTALAINYFLLPHHNEHITNEYRVTCDRVSRFTTEVESGGVLRIMSGSQYDDLNVDMYNSTIHVKEGGSLVLGDYNTITAKRGNCRIIIDGSLSLDSGLKCKAEEGATLELIIRRGAIVNNNTINGINLDNAKIMNYSDNIIITGFQAINNSTIQSYGGNVTIINGGCEESNIRLENFLSDQSAKATVKGVGFGGNNNSSVQALFMYNYGKYEISDNIIADYNKGIQLMFCGNGASGNQIINNNQIYGHSLAGVVAYNTTGKFSGLNKIYDNGAGLQFFNKCLISMEGNSLATDISQTQQIYDNAGFELYASHLGFPAYCRYNYISDPDNGGNPTDPIVYYDNDVNGSYQLVDVSRNCWGTGFSASQDLKINNGYIQFLPFWCPGGGGGGGGTPATGPAEQLFNTASAYVDSGMCVIASSYFKEIIDLYPQSEYAMPAMKQLYNIEQCSGADYLALTGYFLGNESIINDSSLAFLGSYLANECRVARQDWPAALAWYEEQIMNPRSPEDSLFALIDLQNLYIIMENSGLKQAVVGKLAHLKPADKEQFFANTEYYLSLLPLKKGESGNEIVNEKIVCRLEQNTPNPCSQSTAINYHLYKPFSVRIDIKDMTGRVLYTKNEGDKDKGNYTITLYNLNLEAGNYLYSIYLNDKLFNTKKMTIIR